jgi:hypothetical protein
MHGAVNSDRSRQPDDAAGDEKKERNSDRSGIAAPPMQALLQKFCQRL